MTVPKLTLTGHLSLYQRDQAIPCCFLTHTLRNAFVKNGILASNATLKQIRNRTFLHLQVFSALSNHHAGTSTCVIAKPLLFLTDQL